MINHSIIIIFTDICCQLIKWLAAGLSVINTDSFAYSIFVGNVTVLA